MGSPVAFGDIVAAIQTINKVVKTVRDHGGARDDYQRLVNHVESSLATAREFQAMDESHLNSTEYKRAIEAIQALAVGIARDGKVLQDRLLPFETNLGKASPSGWHKAFSSKLRYGRRKEELDAMHRDLEVYAVNMDRQLGLMNAKINVAVHAAVVECLAINKRQEARGQVVCANPVDVDSGIDEEVPPQQVVHQVGHVAVVRGASQATHFDLKDPQQRKDFVVFVLLWLWREALAVCSRIGIGLMPLLHLMATPASSISMLLSDNFHLMDAVGRNYSLNANHFDNWDVLDMFLRTRFPPDVIGSAKVFSSRYRIYGIKNPSVVIDRSTWKQGLKPHKQFRMAIEVSSARLCSMACSTCGYRFRSIDGCDDGVSGSCSHSECSALWQSIYGKRHPTTVKLQTQTITTGQQRPKIVDREQLEMSFRAWAHDEYGHSMWRCNRADLKPLSPSFNLTDDGRGMERDPSWYDRFVGLGVQRDQSWWQSPKGTTGGFDSNTGLEIYRSIFTKPGSNLQDDSPVEDSQTVEDKVQSPVDGD